MPTTKRAKNPRFEVYASQKTAMEVIQGQFSAWRWRLYARNGEIIAVGEGYTSEKDAKRGVAAVKRAVVAITSAEVDR